MILTLDATIHERNSSAMRSTNDADAEHRVLTTESGRDLLNEVAWMKQPGPVDIVRWRRSHSICDVSAAIRLADCRRRAVGKFHRAESMWLEPVGLEQATAEPVARHKATRFAGSLVFDLCSGIGGDALALASKAKVVAVDADHGMTRRMRWNAEIYGVGHRISPLRARAETVGIPKDAFVHIDPDRRAHAGRRAKDVADYQPDLSFLKTLISETRGGAIKLGPASDFLSDFADQTVEIEVVSLGGECKEATIWFGDLAETKRRATCIKGENIATWSDCDGEPSAYRIPGLGKPGSWVFDPDPTLGRAGLLDGFAQAHGLSRLVCGGDFLTGPNRIDSPFLSAFEVEETLPLDVKRLRKVVAERSLGPLEIKTKGLDVRPEDFRKTLRPEGPNPATLLLVGGSGPSLAILARRI